MKNLKKIILVMLTPFLLTGCSLVKDNLENAQIYTTIYPVEYLTKFLYSEHATIESIYPNGADIDTYELTSKQIKEYAKSNLFIYDGLSNEKNIAKNLINQSKKLLIIDVSSGLSYNSDVKELWLSPNNYLMMAKNIKDGLNEYLKSQMIIESVNKKYDEIMEILSLKDADLRAIGKEAKEKGTNELVVSDNAFKFLENYDFEIVSLAEDSLTEEAFNNIENKFKKKTYNKILVLDNNYNDKINKLINESKAEAIEVTSMTTKNSNTDDYLNAMQEMIDNIRNLTIVD